MPLSKEAKMKTLFRTYRNENIILAKKRWFEAKTGLTWQSYSTGDGQRFVPITTKETPLNKIAAEDLIKHLTTDYRSFVDLSEKSGIALPDVVSGAWTLIKSGEVLGTPCRMGGAYAIRLKFKWEIR